MATRAAALRGGSTVNQKDLKKFKKLLEESKKSLLMSARKRSRDAARRRRKLPCTPGAAPSSAGRRRPGSADRGRTSPRGTSAPALRRAATGRPAARRGRG